MAFEQQQLQPQPAAPAFAHQPLPQPLPVSSAAPDRRYTLLLGPAANSNPNASAPATATCCSIAPLSVALPQSSLAHQPSAVPLASASNAQAVRAQPVDHAVQVTLRHSLLASDEAAAAAASAAAALSPAATAAASGARSFNNASQQTSTSLVWSSSNNAGFSLFPETLPASTALVRETEPVMSMASASASASASGTPLQQSQNSLAHLSASGGSSGQPSQAASKNSTIASNQTNVTLLSSDSGASHPVAFVASVPNASQTSTSSSAGARTSLPHPHPPVPHHSDSSSRQQQQQQPPPVPLTNGFAVQQQEARPTRNSHSNSNSSNAQRPARGQPADASRMNANLPAALRVSLGSLVSAEPESADVDGNGDCRREEDLETLSATSACSCSSCCTATTSAHCTTGMSRCSSFSELTSVASRPLSRAGCSRCRSRMAHRSSRNSAHRVLRKTLIDVAHRLHEASTERGAPIAGGLFALPPPPSTQPVAASALGRHQQQRAQRESDAAGAAAAGLEWRLVVSAPLPPAENRCVAVSSAFGQLPSASTDVPVSHSSPTKRRAAPTQQPPPQHAESGGRAQHHEPHPATAAPAATDGSGSGSSGKRAALQQTAASNSAASARTAAAGATRLQTQKSAPTAANKTAALQPQSQNFDHSAHAAQRQLSDSNRLNTEFYSLFSALYCTLTWCSSIAIS